MRADTITGVASAIGIIALVFMVSVAAAIFSGTDASTKDLTFSSLAIIGNLIAVPAALVTWSGVLCKKGEEENLDPTVWREWLGLSFAASLLSAVFVAIDSVLPLSGISVSLTTGAILCAFIALPGALRAWVKQQLSRRYGELED